MGRELRNWLGWAKPRHIGNGSVEEKALCFSYTEVNPQSILPEVMMYAKTEGTKMFDQKEGKQTGQVASPKNYPPWKMASIVGVKHGNCWWKQ